MQHIPSKQATFVTKIWAVCDARSIYVQVYAAKPAGAQSERQNQDMRVVLNLNYLWQLLSITCCCPADAKKKAVHGGNSKKMSISLHWCQKQTGLGSHESLPSLVSTEKSRISGEELE